MTNGTMIFVGLVFLAVFLLAYGMVVPVFGERRKVRRQLEARLRSLSAASDEPRLSTLLRDKYLRELPPWARAIESIGLMARLSRMIDQAGMTTPAYRVLLLSLGLGIAGAVAAGAFTYIVELVVAGFEIVGGEGLPGDVVEYLVYRLQVRLDNIGIGNPTLQFLIGGLLFECDRRIQ